MGALTGAVSGSAEAAKGAGGAAEPPASGAQDGGEETMYALPHDSPAAAVDAGELRHLVRWPGALLRLGWRVPRACCDMRVCAAEATAGMSHPELQPLAWPSVAGLALGAAQLRTLPQQLCHQDHANAAQAASTKHSCKGRNLKGTPALAQEEHGEAARAGEAITAARLRDQWERHFAEDKRGGAAASAGAQVPSLFLRWGLPNAARPPCACYFMQCVLGTLHWQRELPACSAAVCHPSTASQSRPHASQQ